MLGRRRAHPSSGHMESSRITGCRSRLCRALAEWHRLTPVRLPPLAWERINPAQHPSTDSAPASKMAGRSSAPRSGRGQTPCAASCCARQQAWCPAPRLLQQREDPRHDYCTPGLPERQILLPLWPLHAQWVTALSLPNAPVQRRRIAPSAATPCQTATLVTEAQSSLGNGHLGPNRSVH